MNYLKGGLMNKSLVAILSLVLSASVMSCSKNKISDNKTNASKVQASKVLHDGEYLELVPAKMITGLSTNIPNDWESRLKSNYAVGEMKFNDKNYLCLINFSIKDQSNIESCVETKKGESQ